MKGTLQKKKKNWKPNFFMYIMIMIIYRQIHRAHNNKGVLREMHFSGGVGHVCLNLDFRQNFP